MKLSPQKLAVLREVASRPRRTPITIGNPRTWWSLVYAGLLAHAPIYWPGTSPFSSGCRIVRCDGFLLTRRGRRALRGAP